MKEIIPHPNFRPNTKTERDENDIGILKTKLEIGSIEGAKYGFMPICLPGQQFNYESEVATIAGIGNKYTQWKSGGWESFKMLQQCTTMGIETLSDACLSNDCKKLSFASVLSILGLGPRPYKTCRFPIKWNGRTHNTCIQSVELKRASKVGIRSIIVPCS